MPICASGTRTERTHGTTPDEHHRARPVGTSGHVMADREFGDSPVGGAVWRVGLGGVVVLARLMFDC